MSRDEIIWDIVANKIPVLQELIRNAMNQLSGEDE